MFITNNADIASYAQSVGVDRIFIDLEINGKQERQGHLDTVISGHKIEDVSTIRKVIDKSKLLVRVNPIFEGSKQEIDEVIERGADIVMLPMYKTPRDVKTFVEYVNKRAVTCLLLETPEAMVRIDEILKVDGIDEIHIGLNDLHLGMGLKFMFELLSGGIVDYLAEKIKAKGIRFGFGGMAKLYSGAMLPAELILSEHVRLGSEMVILSREFHGRAASLEELKQHVNLEKEVQNIRNLEAEMKNYCPEVFEENRKKVQDIVRNIVKLD